MLRRILQVLAVASALAFLAGAMMTLGIGPFGGTKVRRLFGASAEALKGNADMRTNGSVRSMKTFAQAGPASAAPTAAIDAGTEAPDAGERERMLMPATKSGVLRLMPATKSLGAVDFAAGLQGEQEPAVAPDAGAPTAAQSLDVQ